MMISMATPKRLSSDQDVDLLGGETSNIFGIFTPIFWGKMTQVDYIICFYDGLGNNHQLVERFFWGGL